MALASSVSEAVGPPGRLGKAPIAALGILALALGALQSVLDPALPLLQGSWASAPPKGRWSATRYW